MRCLTICPTFNRPALCEEMVKSFKETTTEASELILGLSKNDPSIGDYLELKAEYKIRTEIIDSNSTTFIYNDIWKRNPEFQYYHLTNDDVVYKTPNWDLVFMWILNHHGGGIIYGNDSIFGIRLCTLPMISANVANALGWLQYDKVEKLFADEVWMRLGVDVPCLYYHDMVCFEHRHWQNGMREQDDTGRKYIAEPNDDRIALNKWLADPSEDIQKVRKALGL